MLLEDPEMRLGLGEKISKRVSEKFSLEKMISQTAKIYSHRA